EDASPPAANSAATASATQPKLSLAGNKPSGAPSPSKVTRAKPAPDEVVKKTIESAGCMRAPRSTLPQQDRCRFRRHDRGGAASSPSEIIAIVSHARYPLCSAVFREDGQAILDAQVVERRASPYGRRRAPLDRSARANHTRQPGR